MSSVDATKPPASPPAALSNGLKEAPPASTKLSTAAKLETQLRAKSKPAKTKAEGETQTDVKVGKAERDIVQTELIMVQVASETVAASTTSTVIKILID